MATTVQSIIEAAYARSAANAPGKTAGDQELIGFVDRIFQALYAVAAASAPERHTARVTLQFNGAPLYVTVPPQAIDLRRLENATGDEINIIPLEERTASWHLAPAVFRESERLYSRGKVGDPVLFDAATLWYLDAPLTLSSLASTLDARFATRHVQLIIDETAIYLTTKDEGRSQMEYESLKASRDGQYATFLEINGLSLSALQSPHAGVILQKLNVAMKSNG